MKNTNILLLDPNPTCELSGALGKILESSASTEFNLQRESLSDYSGQDSSGSTGLLSGVVSRIKPAVIFMVSPTGFLRQAKSLFQSFKREKPDPPVVVVSDVNEPGQMYEMLKLGAADYITSPLKPIEILPRLWRLLEQTCWGETLAPSERDNFHLDRPLIGQSQPFQDVVSKIPIVAQYDVTAMIVGETGTGKELCARAIHQLSHRAERKLVTVNCGSIPNELVESELFGHERGAFTGATTTKQGLIREAEGGTLFLDELDSLPLLAQVKLLRFLQEKEYLPVGATKTQIANVRVIAATNVNLESAVRAGKIRQDLYYRLNMIPIELPPLRDRREDIPLLAANFLGRFAREFRKNVNGFSPDAMMKLCGYDWPGNIRELENVIGRAVAFAREPVIRAHEIALPKPVPESFQEMKRKLVEQFERTYLQSLLIVSDGNITKAAEAAHKNRRAFFELMKKYDIDADQFRPKDDPDAGADRMNLSWQKTFADKGVS
ncbi:MAG: sigma-54 dependent transcriptional regulator [Acidobacteriota bacterium]|nr:sigma-54 dependent transcriptional regulator [Acidobacteriota bacterium]